MNINYSKPEEETYILTSNENQVHNKPPNQSAFQKKKSSFLAWYVGTDYDRQRYCGGKLYFWQFVLANICVAIPILFIISLPFFYFIIIPNIIQGQLTAPSSTTNNENLITYSNNILDITDVTNSSLRYHYETTISGNSWFPGVVTIEGPTTFTLGLDSNFGKGFGFADVDNSFSIDLQKQSDFTIDGLVNITDIVTVRALIGSNSKVQMKTEWTVWFWGIRWYYKLPLSAVYDLSKSTKTDKTENAEKPNPIPPSLQAGGALNSQLNKIHPTGLVSLGPGLPDLYFDDLITISRTNARIIFKTTLSIENPTVAQINVTQVAVIFGNGKTPLMDLKFEPSNGPWEIIHRKQSDSRSQVMTVPLLVTATFRRPSPFGLLLTLTEFGITIGTGVPTLLGPLDIRTPSNGSLFASLTSNLQVELGNLGGIGINQLVTILEKLLL
ncbi:hypothetical protein BC833DRAFT_590003 [Globomyces pollinis-pini]|nr:hypothetical protein BC833DRAFT_590003 [Globomyces pollinis-pini]